MALPEQRLVTFLPSEIFFLAEDELIEILPTRRLGSLQLIGLKTPKLQPRNYAKVPLWLGLILKKQNRCKVVMPPWLQEDTLKQVYEEEVRVRTRFSDKLPWHWFEIGHVLIEGAGDDIENGSVGDLKSLLQDIREIRQAKARTGFGQLNESHIQMDNLGLMEINEMRPFICTVMDQLRKFRSVEEVDANPTEHERPSQPDDIDVDFN